MIALICFVLAGCLAIQVEEPKLMLALNAASRAHNFLDRSDSIAEFADDRVIHHHACASRSHPPEKRLRVDEEAG
jgi:hypothetical protein